MTRDDYKQQVGSRSRRVYDVAERALHWLSHRATSSKLTAVIATREVTAVFNVRRVKGLV